MFIRTKTNKIRKIFTKKCFYIYYMNLVEFLNALFVQINLKMKKIFIYFRCHLTFFEYPS